MTRVSDAESLAALVNVVLMDPDEDGECLICHAMMGRADGMDPTAICNPCAHEAALMMARAIAAPVGDAGKGE